MIKKTLQGLQYGTLNKCLQHCCFCIPRLQTKVVAKLICKTRQMEKAALPSLLFSSQEYV
jgi:hypothetical protein